ncbi:hypothetical protein Ddye_012125 [Dipteronia dyeriana]|uniref:MULE transposase domain-containing protein n=1 Tax=Dipteronia dyeriana TaxID=168575 RepID=A0AAE0CI82_9ROSI|nr:hypothetical protein Ddye_012125 [Dipteronia dyeriana]
MYVSKNMTYEELVSIVQTIVKYDVNKYIDDLQSISIVPGTTCRTFIRNDDDVLFMLGEDRVIPQVNNVVNNEEDEEPVQTERRARRVHRCSSSAVEIDGTSEVRPNVTEVDSDNAIMWCDKDGKFLYFFISLGASLRGFRRFLCPIIAIDGTHLKGRFGGTMFVATAQDENEQVYLIAFGYDDLENNLSWEWFLDCLKGTLGHYR